MIADDSVEAGPLREKNSNGHGFSRVLRCSGDFRRRRYRYHIAAALRENLDKSASRARRLGGIVCIHRGIQLASSTFRCSNRPCIPATRVFCGTRRASVLSASSCGVELAGLGTVRLEWPSRGWVTRVLEWL